MDVRKMEVKQSALSSLKSELIRKKEECLLLKRNFTNVPRKKLKPLVNTEASNDGISTTSLDKDPDEEELLRKSRKCLENKARLYDEKVKSSGENSEELDSESLVNFSKKSAEEEKEKAVRQPSNMNNKTDAAERYNNQNDNSDWVEYVDFLGRTRKCLKEDLEYMKEIDHDFMKKVSKESEQEIDVPDVPSTDKIHQRPEFLQKLHEDWEKQEEQLKEKEDIHYQDVFFDEARAHGVGYYAFSTDEKARAAQQEALQRLRQETKKLQQDAKQKAIQTLTQSTARVDAAKERMLKLLQSAIGEGDLNSSAADSEKASAILAPVQAAMEATQKNVLARRMEQLENLTKEEETETATPDSVEVNSEVEKGDLKRKYHVRPWDEGKEGVASQQYLGYETATPDSVEVNSEVEKDDLKRKYHVHPWDEGKEGVASQQYLGYVRSQEREVMSQEQWVAKKREERPAEFAPLQEPDKAGVNVMEYSLPATSKNSLFFSSKKEVLSDVVPPRTKLFNKFQAPSDSEVVSTGYSATVNANQTTTAKRDPYAGMTLAEISEAVEAGLKYLRQKAEKKSAKPERGFMDIL